jgi:rfaE bifunctional protein nucleotidyltransferase chain/domain
MIFNKITSKIQDWKTAEQTVKNWQEKGETVIFTNGCFDILHYGHLHYLAAAADLGNRLIIGLNSEDSVKRLKGEHRPINDDLTRQFTLASLEFVDLVVVFEEDTPFELIKTLVPNILVKGGDYEIHQIVGADIVIRNGGKVESLPFVKGYSTTNIEDKIKNSNHKES